MNIEESLKTYGLIPKNESLPIIRQMLSHEAELERLGDDREDDLALLCCVQLFSRGFLEDILLIWQAKNAGFDLFCYLDVQFLCGSGLEKTKQYLSSHSSEVAANALKYIMECEKTGDFDDWSPSQHLENYKLYFDVK